MGRFVEGANRNQATLLSVEPSELQGRVSVSSSR